MNWLAILVAALVPTLTGFVWYSEKAFGNTWMREGNLKKEDLEKNNMLVVIGFSLLFSFFIAFIMQFLVIHQTGATAAAMDIKDVDPSVLQNYLDAYGNTYRSFHHGALHGTMTGILLAFPLIAINGLFERKSWKYIFVHAGYWTLTLSIMGSIICGL